MPAGKNRRLTGQPEALERGAEFCRRTGAGERPQHQPQFIITEGEVAKDRADPKRRIRADDLREAALHRKLTSHCIASQ
jgi:hypothetical protein